MSTLAFLCPTLHQCRPSARSLRIRHPPSANDRQRPPPSKRHFTADAVLPPSLASASTESTEPSSRPSPSPPSESSRQGAARERRLLSALRTYARRRSLQTGSLDFRLPSSPLSRSSLSSALQPDYFSRAIQKPDALRSGYAYRRLLALLDTPYQGWDHRRMLDNCANVWEAYGVLCDTVPPRMIDPDVHRRVLVATVPGRFQAARAKGIDKWGEPVLKLFDHRIQTIFLRLRLAGSRPSRGDYAFALWVCSQVGRYETAFALRREMEQDGYELDERTILYLLDALKSRRKGGGMFVRSPKEAQLVGTRLQQLMGEATRGNVQLSGPVLDRLARLMREMEAYPELEQLLGEWYGLDLANPDRRSEAFLKRWGEGAALPGFSTSLVNTVIRMLAKQRDPWKALLVYEVLCHPLPLPAVARVEEGKEQAPEPPAFQDDEDDDWGVGSGAPTASSGGSLPWGQFITPHPDPRRNASPNSSTYENLIASAFWAENTLLAVHFLNCAIAEEKRTHALAVERLREEGVWKHPSMHLSYKAVWLVGSLLDNQRRSRDLGYLGRVIPELLRWRREVMQELVRVAGEDEEMRPLREMGLLPRGFEGEGEGEGEGKLKEMPQAPFVVPLAAERDQRLWERYAEREALDPSAKEGGGMDGETEGAEEEERAEYGRSRSGTLTAYEAALDGAGAGVMNPRDSSLDGPVPRLSSNPPLAGLVLDTPADVKARDLTFHLSVMRRSTQQLQYYVDVHLPNSRAVVAGAHARQRERWRELQRQDRQAEVGAVLRARGEELGKRKWRAWPPRDQPWVGTRPENAYGRGRVRWEEPRPRQAPGVGKREGREGKGLNSPMPFFAPSSTGGGAR